MKRLNKPGTSDHLRRMLTSKEPLIRLALIRAWKKNGTFLSDKDIKIALENVGIKETTIRRIHENNVDLINSKIAPEWRRSQLAAGSFMASSIEDSIGIGSTFSERDFFVRQWVKQRGLDMAVELNKATEAALKSVVEFAVTEQMGHRQAAKLIRGSVGLTGKQQGWVENFYHSEIKRGATPIQARARAQAYGKKVHRMRSLTIARTELANSYNQGAIAHIRRLSNNELADSNHYKENYTADDERVCDICGPLHGERVRLNATFSTGDDAPTFHPRCRCTMLFYMD